MSNNRPVKSEKTLKKKTSALFGKLSGTLRGTKGEKNLEEKHEGRERRNTVDSGSEPVNLSKRSDTKIDVTPFDVVHLGSKNQRKSDQFNHSWIDSSMDKASLTASHDWELLKNNDTFGYNFTQDSEVALPHSIFKSEEGEHAILLGPPVSQEHASITQTLKFNFQENPLFDNHLLLIAPISFILKPYYQTDDFTKKIPRFLILKILCQLEVVDLINVAKTSKQWKSLVYENHIVWKKLYFRRFKKLDSTFSFKWRDFYIQSLILGCSLTENISRLREFDILPQHEPEQSFLLYTASQYYLKTNQISWYKDKLRELRNFHLKSSNWTEAVLTNLELSKYVEWEDLDYYLTSNKPISYPPKATREGVLFDALKIIEGGRIYEIGLQIIDQLEVRCQHPKLIARKKILEIWREKSQENIKIKDRFPPTYFLVEFWGNGFPIYLKDKSFIYRAGELERLGNFTAKIQKKYPKASLIRSAPSSEDLQKSQSRQFFSIKTVNPVERNELEEARKNNFFYEKTKKEWNMSDKTDTFLMSGGFAKDQTKKKHTQLWVKNTYLVVKDAFPSLKKASEVADIYNFELSPLDNALIIMRDKNQELQSKIKTISETNVYSSSFTMILKGVLDAAVMGGISAYKDTFFDPEEQQHTSLEDEKKLERLKDLLSVQVEILSQGIHLHKKIKPDNLLALHNSLETFFEKMKKEAKELEILLQETLIRSTTHSGSVTPVSSEGKGSVLEEEEWDRLLKKYVEDNQTVAKFEEHGV